MKRPKMIRISTSVEPGAARSEVLANLEEWLKPLTARELREHCRARSVPIAKQKPEMVKRLAAALAESGCNFETRIR